MYKIVIADDDEILLAGMCSVFNWGGLDIEVAAGVTDGEKALEAIAGHGADILLTDIKMTKLDGLALTEKVRSRFPDIHIVIMSAYDDFAFAQRALRLSVDDYLLKPVDLDRLKEIMGRITEQKVRKQEEQKVLRELFFQNTSLHNARIEYLAKLVIMGNETEIPGQVAKLEQNFKKAGSNSVVMLSFALSSLFQQVAKGLGTVEGIEEDFSRICTRILKEQTLAEAMELLTKELLKIAGTIAGGQLQTNQQIIRRACDYIEKNFTNPRLRLNDVAREVGLSPNYFSALFTETVQDSFTDYLISRRMKEAQLLLINSAYKSQEIGYLVGYENPSYFSATFKKYVGVNISKYREMIKPDSNLPK